MSQQSAPERPRRISTGWTAVLTLDSVMTSLAALGLFAVGLLLPGIEEEYGDATAPTSPAALVWFAVAALLALSLIATTAATRRTAAERTVRLALRISAVRLALVLLGAMSYVVYGFLTIELA
jgi:hypothetical protein